MFLASGCLFCGKVGISDFKNDVRSVQYHTVPTRSVRTLSNKNTELCNFQTYISRRSDIYGANTQSISAHLEHTRRLR